MGLERDMSSANKISWELQERVILVILIIHKTEVDQGMDSWDTPGITGREVEVAFPIVTCWFLWNRVTYPCQDVWVKANLLKAV